MTIKAMAIKILCDQQQKAPQGFDRYPFFECYLEMDVIATGAVYSVGDGHIQLVAQPTPGLVRAMSERPGADVLHIARQKQCQSYNEFWINTIATGQGCRLLNRYRRRI